MTIPWAPADFGLPVPGLSQLAMTGTTQATAYQLTRKANVFGTVPSGSGCVLPSSYSAGAEISILNRDPSNTGLIYPAFGDRIEGGSINIPISVAAGSNVSLLSFDPPTTASPRTWWITSSQVASGAYLPLTGGTVTGHLTVDGIVFIGTGTPGNAGQYGFQTAFDADPSIMTQNARQNIFNTNLTYSGTTSRIWENLNSFVAVNGPGTAAGEINLAHTYLQVNAGAHVGVVENYESSAVNSGIIGAHAGYLAIFQNTSSATSTSLASYVTYLINDNTTPGSIGEWDAISIGAMQGAGSRPTFYNAMRIADSYAGIVTIGGINIGNLGNATPGALTIQGADTSGGTFPLVVKDSSLARLFDVSDSGIVYAAVFNSPNVAVTGLDTSGGTFPFTVKNSSLARLFDIADDGNVYAFLFNTTKVTIGGSDNSGATFPVDVKNLAASPLFSVSNSGAAIFGLAGVTIAPTTSGILSIAAPDNTAAHFALSVKNLAASILFNVDNSGVATFGLAGVVLSPSAGGQLNVTGQDNTAGHYAVNIRNLAGNVLLNVDNSGAIRTNNFTANGSVATALTSLGPAGASTTVQTWFTVTDNTGTVRYIPAF